MGVKFISYYENSGYGLVARMFIKALLENGINTTWTPLRKFGFPKKKYQPYKKEIHWEKELKSAVYKETEYDLVFISTVPEHYKEWVDREKGKTTIGFSIWETTALPDHWPPLINQLDYLIVPTDWNKKLYRQHGVTVPIVVIPHISQFEGQPAPSIREAEKENNKFRFYTISTWTERKQMIKNVEVFLNTFTDSEPVELFIKTSEDDIMRPKWRIPKVMRQRYHSPYETLKEYLNGTHRSPSITMIADDHLTDAEIQQIHSTGDCYISLCRTEGWGMGAFEAAFYGKPILMTGFGGQTDFLPDNKAWLIDYHLVSVEDKQAPNSYSSNQEWAEPDLNDAARKMRYIYDNRIEAGERGEKLKKYVEKEFNKKKTVNKLLKFIETLPSIPG
jgi:glycosyltransferase involved in cell wall biosynthesis